MSNNIITIDFTSLYKQRGRPKKNPQDKKPRKNRKNGCSTTSTEETRPVVEPQQEAIQKWTDLKVKWNRYYQQNRERILHRKKELREAKDRLLHETLGMKKQEHRGRKPKEMELEKVETLKCLHSKASKTTE